MKNTSLRTFLSEPEKLTEAVEVILSELQTDGRTLEERKEVLRRAKYAVHQAMSAIDGRRKIPYDGNVQKELQRLSDAVENYRIQLSNDTSDEAILRAHIDPKLMCALYRHKMLGVTHEALAAEIGCTQKQLEVKLRPAIRSGAISCTGYGARAFYHLTPAGIRIGERLAKGTAEAPQQEGTSTM